MTDSARSSRPYCSVIGLAAWASVAVGQETQPADASESHLRAAVEDGVLEEVVLTGTRIRSPFTAPTPTQTIGAVELQERGADNVYSLLQEMPAFNSRLSGAANGVRTQTPGQTFADLRGLGSPRTLVLVDSRRFVPSVPSASVGNPYQVDLNLIPALMIDRIDIVTGGASAQWGSDAVAGVVNLILKKQVEGVHAEIQGGTSERGDGREWRAGMVSGFSFADERGHVVFSGDFTKNDGLGNYRSRDWADDYWQFYTDPSASAANGRPRMVMRRNTQPGNFTPGGLIVNAAGGTAAQRAALIGLQFDSATSVSPFVRGEFNPATTPTTFAANQAGGNNPDGAEYSMIPAVERQVLYGRTSYRINDGLDMFLDASWGRSTGDQTNQPIRDRVSVFNPTTLVGTQARIYADNPFIPDALRAAIPMPAGASTSTPPAQSFVLGRVAYDNEPPQTVLRDTAYTASTGLDGALGGNWTWNAAYTYGENEYFRRTYNMRNRALYALAADVIDNPATPGVVDPICRSTLTDPNNGCVPVNLFGNGTPSRAAFEYYSGTPFARVTYRQQAAQLNFQGTIFDNWAGPVAVAFGAEWRHETLESVLDEVAKTGVYDLSLGSEFEGSFNVKEGYFETTVPLISDASFAHSLALNGAIRYADYSDFGGATTWKGGVTWEPFDGLLIRGTHSLDIRAPSIYELDSPATTSLNNVLYNGTTHPGVQIDTIGNKRLQPERSHTTTFGASYTPAFASGLSVSADFFDIDVDDVIATVGQVEIARLCEHGVQVYCDLLEFNNTGALIRVINELRNLSSLRTRGVDLVGTYSMDLGAGGLSLRANATYVDRFTIAVPGAPGEAPSINEQAGQLDTSEGATPRWKANVSLTYSLQPFSLTTQVRWVGPGKIDNAYREAPTATAPADIDPETNHIGNYFLFNLSGTYDLTAGGRAQLFWVVNNLFDRDPPIIPSATLLTQTNGTHYDVMGRFYKLGVRVGF
ncbi:TonB-dependent receptor plug domain-containing protein [Peristeroidobacter soli]|uniref:TonB-dependent receptor plug domain-containing protein n=1 Tax=Peristeroidobacter soli TaxID=2497877 RepID=UPI00158D9C3C|nr:TonB-dependent receptor [Peristeroidobacter soli]